MPWADWINLYEWTDEQKCYFEEQCQEKWDQQCTYYSEGQEYWQLTTAFSTDTWFIAAGLVSGIVSFIFFLLIWQNKELQVHPMKLFMYQGAAEALCAFLTTSSYKMCQLRLPEILSYTLFFSNEWQYRFGALNMLANSANNLTLFFGCLQVCFCIALCFDLMIMLKKPFQMKDRLIPIYTAASVLMAMVLTGLLLPRVQAIDAWEQYLAAAVAWTLFIFYFGIVIVSTIFACYKLNGPGISSEVRRLVLVRHIMTMLTYLVVNIYSSVGFCIATLPRWHGNIPDIDGPVWRILKVIWQVQGLILPLQRITEPFFYQIVFDKLRNMFGGRKRAASDESLDSQISLYKSRSTYAEINATNATLETERATEKSDGGKEDRVHMAPLFFFLASSLNVELVYIILKSITQFVYICPIDHVYTVAKRKQQKIIKTETRDNVTLELNSIKIKNYQNWAPASGEELYQNENFGKLWWDKDVCRQVREEDRLEMKVKVRITFYNMLLFKTAFGDFYKSCKVLHASLSPKFNLEQVFKAGEGAGKSGSFFFFSHDKKFIIKTMSSEELALFKKIHPSLAAHHQKNPFSLLAKIIGVFTVQSSRTSDVHILLMENVLQIQNQSRLKYIFDLKGSLVDRVVKGKVKNTTTLKDKNFLKAKKVNPKLTNFYPDDRELLRTVMKKDLDFLKKNNLMDYSLLLAVERKDKIVESLNELGESKKTITLSKGEVVDDHVSELISKAHCYTTDKKIFHLAIIDYLQGWTVSKRFERFSKMTFLGQDGATMSPINPHSYASRFMNFMETNMLD